MMGNGDGSFQNQPPLPCRLLPTAFCRHDYSESPYTPGFHCEPGVVAGFETVNDRHITIDEREAG